MMNRSVLLVLLATSISGCATGTPVAKHESIFTGRHLASDPYIVFECPGLASIDSNGNRPTNINLFFEQKVWEDAVEAGGNQIAVGYVYYGTDPENNQNDRPGATDRITVRFSQSRGSTYPVMAEVSHGSNNFLHLAVNKKGLKNVRASADKYTSYFIWGASSEAKDCKGSIMNF